ncbi:MAG TPA: DUF3037 domain-containing protein [Flavobacteriales bacterium]|nr:DUF3037 domain-containing protein [Flavobacteriales bacterium]
MPEPYVYEYAVLRLVPVLPREEFINVGIVLFSKNANYIRARFKLDEKRLAAFQADLDIAELHEHLHAFERIAHGDATAGPIAALDPASRFRWLTAVRSSALQPSRPHPGMCKDLDATVNRLFEELVA